MITIETCQKVLEILEFIWKDNFPEDNDFSYHMHVQYDQRILYRYNRDFNTVLRGALVYYNVNDLSRVYASYGGTSSFEVSGDFQYDTFHSVFQNEKYEHVYPNMVDFDTLEEAAFQLQCSTSLTDFEIDLLILGSYLRQHKMKTTTLYYDLLKDSSGNFSSVEIDKMHYEFVGRFKNVT